MTFEDRLAALGVDLSDLPKVHSYEKRFAVAKNIFGIIDKELINRMNRACDLIDVIDRMETRLVNVTGERDYLLTQVEEDCMICANADPKYHMVCAKYDILPDDCFEFEGVPEDWRADDD